jgi:hypothetical protein
VAAEWPCCARDIFTTSRPNRSRGWIPSPIVYFSNLNASRLKPDPGLSDAEQRTMSKQANQPTRRAFVSLIPGALALSGCVTTQSQPRYTGPAYRVVEYQSGQKPGTIIVDPGNHFLYSVQDARQALQYEIGTGKEGLGGRASRPFTINRNGQTGIRLRTFCSANLKLGSIWSNCKAVAACTAGLTIRSAPGRCTCGRATLTRFIASTAPMSLTASATTFPRAAFV